MSLYKRLHEVQQGPATAGATKRRDPVLDELRQRIHHHLIDELGPILYDKRLSEDDLRRRVHEQLQARKTVVAGKSVTSRVGPGGSTNLKIKKHNVTNVPI